jgi:hypothetical protein
MILYIQKKKVIVMSEPLPTTLRTSTLVKAIKSTQNAVDMLLEGAEKEGAHKALELLRKELGLSDNQQ